MLPVQHRYAATSPRVAANPFMQTHARAFQAIAGRNPSAFERATAEALWGAYLRLESLQDAQFSLAFRRDSSKAFTAVSAATGSGKTVGTCALIAHLSPAPCAFVIQTVEECDRVFRELDKLLPGKVAVFTSLHKTNASPKLIEEKAKLGFQVARRFSESDFKVAQVVVTTHERWKREVKDGSDLGVRFCDGNPRDLVVVDEDPSLEEVFVKQPEDVSRLASVLADKVLSGEARDFGFATSHNAADTLSTIHNRMREVKDNANTVRLYASDLVTADDADTLNLLTYRDVAGRLTGLPVDQRTESADALWDTVKFLKAASQGRVFYSRDCGGAFYAYALKIQPQPRTLILDGTADLNGMYAIGSHVVVSKSDRPNYSPIDLALVNPPREFVGKMKPTKLLRARRNAEPFMRWFIPFLVENTTEGEEVLVYAKDALLGFDLHKAPEYDESGSSDPFYSVLKGRRIHWCNFGRGRGSNRWQHCTAYFRLGDFYLKKAVLLSRIGSVTGKTYSGSELSSLSSGRSRDPMLKLAEESHLVVANKQDAARICIRHLSDEGTCKPARLYLVDCDKTLLSKYRERMFPGSSPFRVIECNPKTASKSGRTDHSGTDKLVDLLLTHGAAVLTSEEVKSLTGITSENINRTLASTKVAPVAASRGWAKSTRKAVGLTGKGYVLARTIP
jgi:hypothetical protein